MGDSPFKFHAICPPNPVPVEVDVLLSPEWDKYAEKAHLICFNKLNPAEKQRIDFALVSRWGDRLMGYVTCREMDADTVYWQFGGAFPGTKDTALTFKGYTALIGHCKNKYKRITTLIENTNTPMLKMAMKAGFLIVGIRNYNASILLEHVLEFRDV